MSTFYENKVIALTGGTGCVGQGIIEKLLRDCPKIQHIYLLIRNKKNVAPDERMKKLFQLPVNSFVNKFLWRQILFFRFLMNCGKLMENFMKKFLVYLVIYKNKIWACQHNQMIC